MDRGFKYKSNGSSEFIDSSTFYLTVKTIKSALLAAKNTESENVLNSDFSYVFTDKHKENTIVLSCELESSLNYSLRRYIARNVAAWLDQSGELVLNYEPDKFYEARLDQEIGLEINSTYDKFQITFIVQPVARSTYQFDNLTWEEATIPWEFANFPWEGYPTSFDITGVGTITVTNVGKYEELPLIKLSGTAASITLADDEGNSFTYSNLSSGTNIYIDCRNKLVYSISGSTKVNQRSNLSGNYLKLLPGENTIDISGTITSVNIYFDYRNAYL